MQSRLAPSVVSSLCAIVATLGAACAEPLAPRDLAGSFALVAPMPAVVSATLGNRVVAETLILREDRTAFRRVWFDRWTLAGGDTTRELHLESYTFRIENDAVGLLSQCPLGQTCAAVDYRTWYDVIRSGAALRPQQQPEALFVRIGAAAP